MKLLNAEEQGLIAIDTNILVRLFVNEKSDTQLKRVTQFLANEASAYISQIVQIELVWVLESSYNYDKPHIIFALETLQKNSEFTLENPTQFSHALELYQSANADFSDYMIFANSQDKEHEFWTFDKKLAKTTGVYHLKAS